MKTTILSIFCLIALFSASTSIAQNYTLFIDQPQTLQADAGIDIILSLGNSVPIGAPQPALFGYGDYHYEWSPAQWLDNPYAANPVATPLDTITYTLRVFDFNECIAEDQMTVFVNSASVNSYKVNDFFAIYPNPSHGEFYIHSENEICIEQINIYDLTGKLIYTEESSNGENIYRNINVSGQPVGQYFIQIIADSKTYNGKITIN